jgi:hypothetical protein
VAVAAVLVHRKHQEAVVAVFGLEVFSQAEASSAPVQMERLTPVAAVGVPEAMTFLALMVVQVVPVSS